MNRRLIRAVPRRITAGLAAVVAGTLCVTLLVPQGDGGEDAPRAKPPRQGATAPLDEEAAQRQARSTGKRVEVTALRGATSTTHALPDGTFELTAHAAPVRAKVGGGWKAIDTSLERTADGWTSKATVAPVTFHRGSNGRSAAPRSDEAHRDRRASRSTASARTSVTAGSAPSAGGLSRAGQSDSYSPLVTFESDGHKIVMGWPGALPEPVIKGSRALYHGVLPGVDLVLTARDSGFSHVLVVHNAEAAANPALQKLSYRLSSPDLTFHLDPVTNVVAAKSAQGAEIAVSPTPYMWDSAGRPDAAEGTPRHDGTPAATGADVLALPSLAGPLNDAHTAIGGAELAGQGAGVAVLSVLPDKSLLSGGDTVWPVFVDPSITGKTHNWTTTYAKYPDSSFYDGANYSSGTTEARVGYESDTRGLSRSFFTLGWNTSFRGAIIKDANIRLLESYAWSCVDQEMQIWQTSTISPRTTWRNQPAKKTEIGRKSFSHGYNSNCPDAYVSYDAKPIAQSAASGGWTSLTIGLYATNESSSAAWKKFKAEGESAPKIIISYYRPPHGPRNLTMSPGSSCDVTDDPVSVGQADFTFSATGSDPDSDLKYLDFEIWAKGSTSKVFDGNRPTDSAGRASVSLTSASFTNGKTYLWRVRSVDATGATSGYTPAGTPCAFVYDSSAPSSPGVTSTKFPEDDGDGTRWSTVPFGTAGTFSFTTSTADTVRFAYSFNSLAYDKSVNRTGTGTTATVVTLAPPHAGPNVLYVRAVDSSGNVSSPYKYLHYVMPRPTSDGPGDVTGDGTADLFVISESGSLRTYPSDRTGSVRIFMQAAHRDGTLLDADVDEDGKPDQGGYWMDSSGTPSLITHNGDFVPGDGIQDLVARMSDGKLYVYRGDGYGSVDIDQRLEVQLPKNAPSTSSLTQILAVGDITGDKRPDLLATSGSELWAFTGYTGGTFAFADLLSSEWLTNDLVAVGDYNADGNADLLYRAFSSGRLYLRHGKRDGDGGTSLASLGSAGASLNGTDALYSTGWSAGIFPLMMGTPDVTGDGIPDIWAVPSDGSLRFYTATDSSAGSSRTVLVNGWLAHKAFG